MAAGQRHPAVLGAHGGVEGAQKGPEVRGALEVHHGVEGLQEEQRDTLASVCERYRESTETHNKNLFILMDYQPLYLTFCLKHGTSKTKTTGDAIGNQ